MPYFDDMLKREVYKHIGSLVAKEDIKLLAIGGTYDHVHMLVKLKGSHVIADLVQMIKSKSSRFINKRNSELDYFAWQKGYGAFSVSPSRAESAMRYINNQEEHHKVASLKDELKFFLGL